MKQQLVLAGLGHGQLEILNRIEVICKHYDVRFLGDCQTIYTGAFPQVIAGHMDSDTHNDHRL